MKTKRLALSFLFLASGGAAYADAYYNFFGFFRGSQANNPIQLVQSAPPVVVTNSASSTVTLPGASKAGDLVVVSAWMILNYTSDYTGANVTDSFGNTYALATSIPYTIADNSDWGGDAAGYTAIFYAKSISVPNNTPITISVNLPNLGSDGSGVAVTAAEYSGIDQANPLDQVASNSGGTASLPESVSSGTTPTTTKAYELLISSIGGDDDNEGGDDIVFQGTGSPIFSALTSQTSDGFSPDGVMSAAITSSTGAFTGNWNVSIPFDPDTTFQGFGATIATFKGLQTTSNVPAATQFVLTPSTGQTLKTHVCSSALTIQSKTASSQVAPLSADQTISLSGTGLQFYSDSACTNQVTSLSFAAAITTSQTFYFMATTPGTITLTATPTTFSTLTQNETISLAHYTWTGTAGDGNWNTNGNWSNTSYPTGSHQAIFDGNCTNCTVTMNSGVTQTSGTTLYSSFTGSVTQASGSSFSGNFTQQGGTWNVSGGTFSTSYSFLLSGGNFNLGSGTFTSLNNTVIEIEGGTFDGSTGTLQMGAGGSNDGNQTLVVNGGSFTIQTLNIDLGSAGNANFAGNIYVSGNLTMNNTAFPITSSSTSNVSWAMPYPYSAANLYVSGNVNATSGGGCGGDGCPTIILNGTGSQTITGTTSGSLPNLTIAQGAGGTVTLSNSGTIQESGVWTYTSGTVIPGTSTVSFGVGNPNIDEGEEIFAPTMDFNNVLLNDAGSNDMQSIRAMNVLGTLTVNNGASDSINGGGCGPPGSNPLNLSGNLVFNSGGFGLFCANDLTFVGTNAQTISITGGGIIGGGIMVPPMPSMSS